MEIFECASCPGTILHLVENKARSIRLNFHIWHSRSYSHNYCVDIEIRQEKFLVFRMFTKIKIHNMFKMMIRKINNTACLSTLTDSFHHNRFMRGLFQPRQEF